MATVIVREDFTTLGAGKRLPATISDDQKKVRLVCSRHPKNSWCAHMADLCAVSALDALQIDAIDGDEGARVSVPLMPSVGAWASVRVESVHHGGMHSVALAGTGTHIGTLAPGEGRYAIRQMIWEWIKFIYPTAPNCRMKTHPTSERKFRPKRPDAPRDPANASWEDLLNAFYTFTTGHCRSCEQWLEISTDIPDL